MARYYITSLNYISSGSKRCYVNMDTCLEHYIPEYVYVLDLENHAALDGNGTEISGNIRTEQGDISAINTKYYQYEDGNHKDLGVGLEKDSDGLLIPEDIERVKEGLSSNGKLILLKQDDNKETYLSEIRKFNSERFEHNRTFVIPFLNEREREQTKAGFFNYQDSDEIGPMYEIKDVCIKLAQKKAKTNQRLKMTDEDIDIYSPSLQESPIQFCQTYDNAVMLDTSRNNDLYNLRVKFSDVDDTYATKLQAGGIDAITYVPCNKLSFDTVIEEYDELGNKIDEKTVTSACNDYGTYVEKVGYGGLQDIFDDYSHLNGIKYNLVYNLDQTDEPNDCRNGNVAADDIFVGKNLYNATYSIENDESNNLSDCREYCGIGFSNGYVYLKYYDGVRYSCSKTQKDDHGKNQCSMVQKDDSTRRYQKVEFLQKVRNSKRTEHKSNVFSVNVKNTHINDLEQSIQNIIKKDITNAITKITENVCPVNTQLFQVYFDDD